MHSKLPPLPLGKLMLCSLGAVGCYHLAMLYQSAAGWFVLAYLFLLWQLRRARTARASFYLGWIAGMGIMIPHTWFLLGIFHEPAVLLWMLMSVWLGLMVSLWQACAARWSGRIMLLVAPCIMLGVEYFRSEVWALKFAWLTAGFALPAVEWGAAFHALGVYGLGAALLMLVILATSKWRLMSLAALPLLAWPLGLGKLSGGSAGDPTLSVAGVQWEDASEKSILTSLSEAKQRFPQTQLFVTSEYSFPGPPTDDVRAWAKVNGYLMTGGADMVPGKQFDQYYNTAFLTGPEGNVIHKQVKAVPIQFMDDGLPAPKQEVWQSPWGRVGICICYDMNYASVNDELVRQGAQVLIIPAMDREKWGESEHILSARLGPVRAVEYGLPVFRLASSGISQVIQRNGQLIAEGYFPGQGAIVAGTMFLPQKSTRPLDRWLVWPAMIVSGGLLLGFIALNLMQRIRALISWIVWRKERRQRKSSAG